jgi:hypothetical protein
MPRHELDRLAATLALPWNAQQEARRYQQRGGPRRTAPRPGGRPALDLAGQIAVTLIHQRLHLPRHVIAWLAGTHPATISQAIAATSPLLSQHQPRTSPASARLRTPDDLIRYAAAAGITLPSELKSTC